VLGSPVTDIPPVPFSIPRGTDAATLIDALRGHLSLGLREEPARNPTLTLLDTFDWRVHEAGGYLALEAAGKARRLTWWPPDASAALASAPVPGLPRFVTDLPPGDLRERLTTVVETRALLPLVRLRSHVRPFDLIDGSEKTVLRLTLEEHRAEGAGHRNGPWLRRLRVLPVRGYPQAVDEVLRLARGPLGLSAEERPLHEEALAAVGRAPGDYSSSLDFQLAPDQRADAALQVVLRRLLDTALANEDGIRRQIDTEFLHDLRVAVRRARSLLGQVKGVFPDRNVQVLRKELGWLGSRTNVARDMDVYLHALETYRGALPSGLADRLEPLRGFLLEHRARAYRDLGVMLDSARFRRLVHRWRGLARRPSPRRPTAPRAAQPIARVARKRIWRAYRGVMRAGSAIRRSSPPRALHEVRIACKKLRYLMEFFRSLFPAESIGQLIKALKAFQDNLGEYQDLAVQQDQLRGFERAMAREGGLPAKTREAMERLVEHLAGRQAEVRQHFAERFAEFSGEETTGTFRRLFRAAPKPGEASA